MKQWEHNELAEDLAYSKNTKFLDVNLGSSYLAFYRGQPVYKEVNGITVIAKHKGVQRADVVEIKPSYTRFCMSIFEVKVSRSDFLKDIRTEKWKGYLDHCHRFYFAAPAGLLTKNDVPDPAGLIVRGERGWTVVKGARALDTEIPVETMMSLLFYRGTSFSKLKNNYRKMRELRDATEGIFSHYDKKEVKKAVGEEVAKAIEFYRKYKLNEYLKREESENEEVNNH